MGGEPWLVVVCHKLDKKAKKKFFFIKNSADKKKDCRKTFLFETKKKVFFGFDKKSKKF